MPCEQERGGKANDLLVTEPLAIDLGCDQAAEEILPRLDTSSANVFAEVVVKLTQVDRRGLNRLLVGRISVALGEQGIGPSLEAGAICGGHPQKLGDHDHRQRISEIPNQFDPGTPPSLIQQLLGELFYTRL